MTLFSNPSYRNEMSKRKGHFLSRNSLTSVYQLRVKPKGQQELPLKAATKYAGTEKDKNLGMPTIVSSVAPSSKTGSLLLNDNHERSSNISKNFCKMYFTPCLYILWLVQ